MINRYIPNYETWKYLTHFKYFSLEATNVVASDNTLVNQSNNQEILITVKDKLLNNCI